MYLKSRFDYQCRIKLTLTKKLVLTQSIMQNHWLYDSMNKNNLQKSVATFEK